MWDRELPPADEPAATEPTAAAPEGDAPASGRSLMALGSRGDGCAERPPARPSAAFLAQLIAAAQQWPQLRQRRRAEPQDGAASYVSPAVVTPGRSLSRSI